MFLDWIIRSFFFYHRLISGKWLWRHQKRIWVKL